MVQNMINGSDTNSIQTLSGFIDTHEIDKSQQRKMSWLDDITLKLRNRNHHMLTCTYCLMRDPCELCIENNHLFILSETNRLNFGSTFFFRWMEKKYFDFEIGLGWSWHSFWINTITISVNRNTNILTLSHCSRVSNGFSISDVSILLTVTTWHAIFSLVHVRLSFFLFFFLSSIFVANGNFNNVLSHGDFWNIEQEEEIRNTRAVFI